MPFKKTSYPLSISFYYQIITYILIAWQFARNGIFDNPLFWKMSRKLLDAVESNDGIIHIKGLDNIRKTKKEAISYTMVEPKICSQ